MFRNLKRLLVTGGAGFIGSSFIRAHLNKCERLINYDSLTYAANLKNLKTIEGDPRYRFIKGDIRDFKTVQKICEEEKIDAIVHFAAESHVDRSIENPMLFCETNVLGTLSLLEVVRKLPHIHFHHISTDEVYGSIENGFFSEDSSYLPNSPYAASKASSDHLVRAYGKTYGISTTLSHCSNNFGPCQFEEKLIPKIILNCIQKKPIPIYGNGENVRDWLFVDDHSDAIWLILQKGENQGIYDIGGECEMRNIDIAHEIIEQFCFSINSNSNDYRSLTFFAPDRPGHDLRYAIDCSKIKTQLGWSPKRTFKDAIRETIAWYVNENCLCDSSTP